METVIGCLATFSWMIERMLIHLLKLSFCFAARAAEASSHFAGCSCHNCMPTHESQIPDREAKSYLDRGFKLQRAGPPYPNPKLEGALRDV